MVAVRRRFGVLLGLILLAAGFVAPGPVTACSCAGMMPLADYVKEPTGVVLVGWVGPQAADGYAFRVERWFAGPGPTQFVTMVPGDSAMCGINLTTGQHLVAVAYRDEQGLLHPSLCSPSATVETPEGRALVADAERTFGSPPASPTVDPPTAPAPEDEPALPWPLVAFAGIGGLLLGIVAVLRRRSTGAGG